NVFRTLPIHYTSTSQIFTLSLHDALPIFGLSIAVPTLIGFTYFSRKVEVMSVEMETLVVELINKCYYGRAAREHKVSNIPTSVRSEEHTSELQSPYDLVCRLLLEKKKNIK